MSRKSLTGWEHRTLRTALAAAFDAKELKRLTKEGLDVTLANILDTAVPFDDLTFELVGWADRNGDLLRLFQAAAEVRPQNESLRRAMAEVFHAKARNQQLQAIVNSSGAGGDFRDSTIWRDEFAQTELAVCRIENPAGRPWGTGWLLSNDLIITNRHVWRDALGNGRAVDTVRAAFNYRVLPNGQEAFATRLALAATSRVVTESAVEDLDFVLLRLERALGGTPVASYPEAPLVLPLSPKAHDFVGGEPAIILQHPSGAPLKIAWGVMSPIAAQNIRERILYQVNTEPGSSGSPVFLTDWRPTALHAQAHNSQANAGVPMSLILPLITKYLFCTVPPLQPISPPPQ